MYVSKNVKKQTMQDSNITDWHTIYSEVVVSPDSGEILNHKVGHISNSKTLVCFTIMLY